MSKVGQFPQRPPLIHCTKLYGLLQTRYIAGRTRMVVQLRQWLETQDTWVLFLPVLQISFVISFVIRFRLWFFSLWATILQMHHGDNTTSLTGCWRIHSPWRVRCTDSSARSPSKSLGREQCLSELGAGHLCGKWDIGPQQASEWKERLASCLPGALSILGQGWGRGSAEELLVIVS